MAELPRCSLQSVPRFAHFGALQVANFQGNLSSEARSAQDTEVLCVTIALDDLGGDGVTWGQASGRFSLRFGTEMRSVATAPEMFQSIVRAASRKRAMLR